MHLDRVDSLNPSLLLRPLSTASMALGRLAHALEATPLHATWLWREITRAAVQIAQAGGYQARVDQLRMALIGAPLERADHTPGLAAATRIFLAAAPLFQNQQQADSKTTLWPQYWYGGVPGDDEGAEPLEGSEPQQANSDALSGNDGGAASAPGEGGSERDLLVNLVQELAGFADDGRRPALINLLVDLRKHAATRHLSPGLVRIALPLALLKAGLVPRAAPGLLGGRRLALGMGRAVTSDKPLTDWLKTALDDLAKEAEASRKRLAELTSQHRAWHGALADVGLRRHAKAPKALDLLTATPVLSIGLLASHIGCSHVASGKVIERLVDLGILIEQTSRSRHKVFVAGDLKAAIRGELDVNAPLARSEPAPAVDVEAVGATLDSLFGELDRLNQRAGKTLAGGG